MSETEDGRALTTIGQIALHVMSISESERFYGGTLGLQHLYTFGDLAFFDCGGTRLYLQAVSRESWSASTIVYFRVGDISGAYERLGGQGVRFQGAPHMIHRHEDGTEEWMAFFTDPAGNVLAIMSQQPADLSETSG